MRGWQLERRCYEERESAFAFPKDGGISGCGQLEGAKMGLECDH